MADDDDVDYAREPIHYSVWSGFEGGDARETIIGDLLLDNPEHDEAALRAYAAAEVARKAAAEKTWPSITDCDRLDTVFAGLAAQGILGLHNAGYTMSDGHADAADALDAAPDGRFVGYCFYHGQDVERVIDGGPLMIAFDHLDDEEPDRLRVGQIVDQVLQAAGFETDWDGTTEERIALPSFEWKRRGPPKS